MKKIKIGNYSIPDLRLIPNIRDDVKKIYDAHKLTDPDNDTAVANLVGHKSAKSGAWYSKLADMRLYGLMEPRGLKLTKLSENLLYGTENEQETAITEAVMNIALWKVLYGEYKANLPSGDFWAIIQRITGVDPLEARKTADSIRKSYLEDMRHIKPVKEEESEMEESQPSGINTNVTTPTLASMAELVKGMIVSGAFDIAKQYIDFIKSKEDTEKQS